MSLAACNSKGVDTQDGGVQPAPGPGDTTPPSVSISAPANGAGVSGTITVSAQANDNVGVAGVRFKVDGNNIGAEDTSAPYAVSWNTATVANGSRVLTAVARDAAGNQTTSSTVTVTVNNTPDTTAPSAPAGLSASAHSSSLIGLNWSASTDNVGVTGYRVERCQGSSCTSFSEIATASGTSYNDSGLSASTAYRYRVRAADAAGNLSSYSNIAAATTAAASSSLRHDGPATPEQLSLFLPVAASLPTTATATVRYRKVGSSSWTVGHPLHRIRPSFAQSGMSVDEGFAWTIIDLTPGTSYEVEVTLTDGAQVTIENAVMATRALPPAAGAPTKTIFTGATGSQVQSTLDSAVPGDVIQFDNGTYTVNNLQLNRSGTAAQPIYIRGQSRSGVVVKDTTGIILHLVNTSHVVIENLTFEGSGVDSGIGFSSRAIDFHNSSVKENVTIRNTTMRGVDGAVVGWGEIREVLVYDNTFTGNNRWDQDLYAYGGSGAPGAGDGTPDVDQNIFWNDDGIRIAGKGNAAFNNTLTGFGDSLAMNDGVQSIGVHFYRNDIRMTGDDAIEGDYGFRNISFYDNRVHNAMTLVSLDPIWGGPFLAARNIGINIGRGPYKLNASNTGHFFYNNTVVRSHNPDPDLVWGWVQFNNGSQRAWGYRNNMLIYYGSGNLLAMEAGGQSPIDFTHNSWYPNRSVWWTGNGGSYNSLALAYGGLPQTTPLFSGSTRRHEADNISEANPFETTVNLGATYHTQVTTLYTPTLASGMAAKNSGVAIPNITDGYSGAAPDRGALIAGLGAPAWGDRSPP